MMRWIACLLALCCLTTTAWANHEQVTLLLKWKHQFQFAGYYMAVEKGFYHDAGLDVHIIENNSSHDISQAITKKTGVYGIVNSGILLAYAKGQPIQAMAAMLQHSPMALMVLKDANIRRLEDLTGKRISLATGIEGIAILADLKQHHVDAHIQHDVKLGIDQLIQHRTDAFPVYISNEPQTLRKQGIPYRIFHPKDDGIDFYSDILVTSQQETSQHPERAANFLKATQRGWIYALNHIDESIDVILQTYNPQHLSREHLLFEAETLKKLIMPDVVLMGYMNSERWERIAETYASLGFIPHNLSLTNFIYQAPKDTNHWLWEHRWELIASILVFFLGITFLVAWVLRRKGLDRIAQLEAIQRNTMQIEAMQYELKEKNQQLKKALEGAEQATQAKGQFLATMSHEIRTPLNGVLGLTELVLNTDLTSQQRDHLHTIQASGTALLSILNDILDFSKIEAGLMEIKTRPFNPNDLIEHVAKLFSLQVAKHKSVSLITQGLPLLPHLIMGDVDHLHQVLVNLLSNAVKFTEHGDIILSVIQQSETDHHVMLRFQISDTGAGISSDDQARLFDAFTQADSSHQRKHGGTGLGLSIVKRLVHLMGSQIQVNSTLGSGSRFFFDLQLEKSEDVNIEGPHGYLSYFSQWKVLLVSHHGGHRNILQYILETWGIDCTSCSSIDHVQQALSDTHFDMVLMSQECLDMNDMVHIIQHDPVKLIMMIQNNTPMDLELREHYGLDGFIRKPIFIRSLCETLLSVMSIKKRHTNTNQQTSNTQRKEHILLAEDNLVNQQVVLGMLKHQGFTHIDTVEDGLEAVQQSKKQHYDLILMDVQMPNMDGLSACREIRTLESMQDLPRTPILALTAHALEEDRQESLQAGMDEHLTKPLTGKRLQEALAIWLPHTMDNNHSDDDTNGDDTSDSETSSDIEVIASAIDKKILCQLRQDIGFGIGMILDTYIHSLPEHLQAIKEAIANGDGDALRRCGHKLKGSSRSVAAISLGELGYQLELLGKTAAIETAACMLDDLTLTIEQVTSSLQEPWVKELY